MADEVNEEVVELAAAMLADPLLREGSAGVAAAVLADLDGLEDAELVPEHYADLPYLAGRLTVGEFRQRLGWWLDQVEQIDNASLN